MGSQLSAPFSLSPPDSPQQQNPKTTSTAIMSSAPETLETQNLNQEQEAQNLSQEQETQKQEQEIQKQAQETQNQAQEEEEEECGLCLYIKKGACKKAFVDLEKCGEEGEKNNVKKCYEALLAFEKCMEANQDHYGVFLQAKKDAERRAMNQLEQEKQKEKEGVIVDGRNQEKDKDKEGVAELIDFR
ncbi:uncharacterized protein [Rutidosis leptorrhynchoides]|uniref:uncharacterized protein n=1 Tax=Rutidosis leptorrhynchoides TaxID=125765 RepID=UPI003A99F257